MAKIDLAKIPGYAEMSAEQKIAALEAFEVESAPPADDIAKLKNALQKANSEAAENKRLLREKQSEAEKAEADREEANKKMLEELNALKREKSISDYTAQFVSVGYPADLAKSSAEAAADGNFATIFKNMTSFIENHDKDIKANVLKQTPSPVGGDIKDTNVTKEQFNKMGYSELVKLQRENPELYSELSK